MAAADISRDGTGQGLVEFFEYLADKGLMNQATARARRIAATKVLGIDEDWESIDLRTLDLDEQFQRFANLEKQNYKPGSLSVYESRFRSAVSEYLDYLRDPSSFKAPKSRKSGKGTTSREANEATAPPDDSNEGEPDTPSAAHSPPDGRPAHQPAHHRLITYPFPLRQGETLAYVQLPPDLRADEAARLGKFIESLAAPEPTEEPS